MILSTRRSLGQGSAQHDQSSHHDGTRYPGERDLTPLVGTDYPQCQIGAEAEYSQEQVDRVHGGNLAQAGIALVTGATQCLNVG